MKNTQETVSLEFTKGAFQQREFRTTKKRRSANNHGVVIRTVYKFWREFMQPEG